VSCPASFTQAGFRGRDDNGNETTAAWLAAQNINWNQLVDKNFRVRFMAQEGAACAGANIVWRLQYNLNGAGWVDGSATSVVIRASASPNLTDAANVTQQLTGGTGAFIGATGFDEGDCNSGGGSMDVAASGNAETEFSVQLRSADVRGGDTIQLRISNAGTAIASYAQTPTITAYVPNYHPARKQFGSPFGPRILRLRGRHFKQQPFGVAGAAAATGGVFGGASMVAGMMVLVGGVTE
jgi:hypothetical protein